MKNNKKYTTFILTMLGNLYSAGQFTSGVKVPSPNGVVGSETKSDGSSSQQIQQEASLQSARISPGSALNSGKQGTLSRAHSLGVIRAGQLPPLQVKSAEVVLPPFTPGFTLKQPTQRTRSKSRASSSSGTHGNGQPAGKSAGRRSSSISHIGRLASNLRPQSSSENPQTVTEGIVLWWKNNSVLKLKTQVAYAGLRSAGDKQIDAARQSQKAILEEHAKLLNNLRSALTGLEGQNNDLRTKAIESINSILGAPMLNTDLPSVDHLKLLTLSQTPTNYYTNIIQTLNSEVSITTDYVSVYIINTDSGKIKFSIQDKQVKLSFADAVSDEVLDLAFESRELTGSLFNIESLWSGLIKRK